MVPLVEANVLETTTASVNVDMIAIHHDMSECIFSVFLRLLSILFITFLPSFPSYLGVTATEGETETGPDHQEAEGTNSGFALTSSLLGKSLALV